MLLVLPCFHLILVRYVFAGTWRRFQKFDLREEQVKIICTFCHGIAKGGDCYELHAVRISGNPVTIGMPFVLVAREATAGIGMSFVFVAREATAGGG